MASFTSTRLRSQAAGLVAFGALTACSTAAILGISIHESPYWPQSTPAATLNIGDGCNQSGELIFIRNNGAQDIAALVCRHTSINDGNAQTDRIDYRSYVIPGGGMTPLGCSKESSASVAYTLAWQAVANGYVPSDLKQPADALIVVKQGSVLKGLSNAHQTQSILATIRTEDGAQHDYNLAPNTFLSLGTPDQSHWAVTGVRYQNPTYPAPKSCD